MSYKQKQYKSSELVYCSSCNADKKAILFYREKGTGKLRFPCVSCVARRAKKIKKPKTYGEILGLGLKPKEIYAAKTKLETSPEVRRFQKEHTRILNQLEMMQ